RGSFARALADRLGERHGRGRSDRTYRRPARCPPERRVFMAQQSTTRPREAEKVQGKHTHEQPRRVQPGAENPKGTDAELPGGTLKEAAKRYPKPGPGDAYTISSGDRSIQRGANDRGPHDKQH